MSAIIIVISIIIAIVIGIVLTLTYLEEQHIKCPHCGLEFTRDLLLLKNNSTTQCPFCHKWIIVKKLEDRLEAKRLFT